MFNNLTKLQVHFLFLNITTDVSCIFHLHVEGIPCQFSGFRNKSMAGHTFPPYSGACRVAGLSFADRDLISEELMSIGTTPGGTDPFGAGHWYGLGVATLLRS